MLFFNLQAAVKLLPLKRHGADDADGESRAGEGLAVHDVVGESQRRPRRPRFVLEEAVQGLDGSLPNGWGRLLVDRTLRDHGIDPYSIGPLARLAIVGKSGMRALEYEPEVSLVSPSALGDLDEIAAACAEMLATDYSDDLDAFFCFGRLIWRCAIQDSDDHRRGGVDRRIPFILRPRSHWCGRICTRVWGEVLWNRNA